jgi:hypothetical protein
MDGLVTTSQQYVHEPQVEPSRLKIRMKRDR